MVLDGLATAYLSNLECRAIGAHGAEQAALTFSGRPDAQPSDAVWSGWGVVYGAEAVERVAEWERRREPVPFRGCIARNGRPLHVEGAVRVTDLVEEEEEGRPCARFLFYGPDEPEESGPPGIT